MTAKRARRPRGVALVMVILCLVVMGIVFGVLARLASAGRKQARDEERRLRASWLAESGLERAWSKRSLPGGYRGEVWEIPADSLGGPDAGRVLIEVEPVPGRPGRVLVRSRADFPRDGASRSRQTRVAEMPAPPPEPAPAPAAPPESGEDR